MFTVGPREACTISSRGTAGSTTRAGTSGNWQNMFYTGAEHLTAGNGDVLELNLLTKLRIFRQA